MFNISFDAQSLAEIAQFYGFKTLLSSGVQAALKQGGTTLVEAIRADMHWQNGTGGEGPLGQSIVQIFDSPYELQVGSGLPYARRRNSGFDGADSLGRVYHDEGAFFMEHGMDASRDQILQEVYNAAEQAFTFGGR